MLSELRRKVPDARVVHWLSQRPAGTLYLSVLTLRAIRRGIEALPDPPLPAIDSLLAATASQHGLILVTRNLRDVQGLGVQILSPWGE